MFKNRVTVVSIILIAGAAVLFLMPGKGSKKDITRSSVFLMPKDVDMVTIKKQQKVIKLVSSDNKWFVTDNNSIEIEIDSSKLLPFFEFANDNNVIQKITKKKEAYSEFELTDEKAAKLVFHKKDGKNITYYIGKNRDPSSQFIRKDGDPYVYLVSKHLRMNQDRQSWFYRKVLDYDVSQLNYVDYNCSDGKKIKIFYDSKDEAFVIKDVPAKKEVKDLSSIKDAFWEISVSGFLPRTKVPGTVPVVTHKLIFKTGEVVVLNFLKASEDKKSAYYLDIKIKADEIKDRNMEYLKTVSDQYIFSLSWFDKKKYQRSFDDFFKDKAEEVKDNSTVKKTD